MPNTDVRLAGYPAAPPFDGRSLYYSDGKVVKWENNQQYCQFEFAPSTLTQGTSGGPIVTYVNGQPYLLLILST